MEPWLMYAFGAFLIVGIFGFLQKIVAEGSLNKNSFIFYAHIGCLLAPIIYVVFLNGNIDFTWKSLGFAIFLNFIYVLNFKARIKSLQSLSSSTFFINYRIFSSTILIIFGQVIFSENISVKEYAGIFIGFIIFYLLLEKKKKSQKSKNLTQGYVYLGFTIICVSTIWLGIKEFFISGGNPMTYLLGSGISGTIFTLVLKGKDSLSDILIVKKKKDILFLGITAIIFMLGVFLNVSTLSKGGDVAIVYKIISYSLFIPIILSIIFYKEKVSKKKIIAFLLTIVSIALFV